MELHWNTQPRATVAVVIYTKGGDVYDCILLIWKSNKKSRMRVLSSIFRKLVTDRMK